MKLTIICVGHKFEPHEEQWISDYLHRIKKYAQVALVRIKDSKDAWAEIQKKIPEKSLLVLLDQKGKSQTTEQLKDWFENSLHHHSSFTFVVGGSYGFNDDQRKSANHLLSLSSMTLPHRIALLLLTEQLYRILTMKAGHPYHHSE